MYFLIAIWIRLGVQHQLKLTFERTVGSKQSNTDTNMNNQGSAPNQLTCDWLFCSMYLLSQCPALCNPMDCSLPGSSVHGIFQARILEWVAISYSRSLSSYSRTDINQNSRLNLMNSLVLSRFCHV